MRKFDVPARAIPPDCGNLGNPEALALRLGDHLDAERESGVELDARRYDELARVRLERVGGVMRAHPSHEVERPSGQRRHRSLEPRASNLAAATHVPGGCGDRRAALDEPGELIDLAGVVTAIGHGHDHDVTLRMVDAEAESSHGPVPYMFSSGRRQDSSLA